MTERLGQDDDPVWSSIGAHALSVAAALFFAVPLLAAASLDSNGRPFLGIVAGLVLASAVRPVVGLTLLVILLPLSISIQHATEDTLLSGVVVDGLMLAFACGASVRLFTGRRCPPSRLAGPAVLLVMAILTSTVAELRILQGVTPRTSIWPAIWGHLTQDYWTQVREFPLLHHTYRWLAWIAAAVYAERVVSSTDAARSWLMRAWWAAGLVGAALALNLMAEILARAEAPFWAAMSDFWRRMRITALQPDVNAAGSYLLLFLVPAAVVGMRQRSRRLLLACVPLLLAFAMARSRAAIGALVLVLSAAAVARLWRQSEPDGTRVSRRPALIAAVVVAGMIALGGTYYATAYSHANLSDAMRIRVDLTETGLAALRRHAVFGVGLGDYIPATRRFMTQQMTLLRAVAPQGENAHNNFLQIAVELGLPGCFLFLWFVGRGIAPGVPIGTVPVDARVEGLALGIVAFLLSAVAGHPLLVPLVGATFFLAVGGTAGMAGAMVRTSRMEAVYWVASGAYLGSLIWRW